ncbi:Ras GTPase activating protein ira2 [Sporothrix stenoceras]
MQGTEFSNLSDTAVGDKYDELIDILTNDTALATAMAAVCPSSEVDELTISLLNVFESRGMGFDLLEAVIKLEVEETESESELLRRTCVATKMLSVYAKWKGSAYLKATLQKVVERLMMTANDLDFELDPTRVKSQDELKKNAVQLQIVAKVFIDDISASSSKIPTAFPPEVEGLVTTTPSKEMRRGLLLIAKIIQNLANNVLFGAKEPYMFPLNEFLSFNIYDVTTFLRKISVAPEGIEGSPKSDATDFGASVSLHRFLYDHWDHVRQRLASQERRDHVRSPGEGPRTRSPVLEPLRNLITNLGPPPLAVTWNRPQITLNNPPAYSRFQNFMLRNAFRSSESFVTARAVYDGGESKDGLSIICIILRNIDADSIDYDTLVFCYLKIASRLWHKPFGLFIDATCYSGQNEPPDELFQKLEALTPTELSRQLSRVYIYNMNSTFRKCFRRILRAAAKNEGSVFHPDNVEYHLVSNMQDLQGHFHLSQVHLPKETLSVVGDIRYVFQQITRLSRSRGKIDVSIKVGSQFVQITTTKKQEIHQGFGLNAIFNDIFRLGDIDQAPMSIQTDDDSAFGLRAENGKIVMYFTSPGKQDILQAIRGAKVKYSKDARALKSFERLVRPQDVPGTLLNLSLANLGSADHTLRLSSYNLLGALCRAFKFSTASSLLCIKDISVPLDPSQFIINISKKLAEAEPQLTTDFLNEFFVGWDSFSDEQKPLSLAYMAPWLPGLRTSLLASDAESDKAKDKISAIFRKLIEVAVSDPSLSFVLEQTVWPAIYQDETLLDLFLEEVVKNGLSIGIHDDQADILTSIVTGIGTITIRGKIISRLRKALNRSSLRPTKHLPDNAVWAEICVLLQFCVSLSFDSGIQSQLYLPEIFHIVTMLANIGTPDVRFLVHRLLANSLHAVCTSFNLDEARLSKLGGALESLSEGKSDLFSNYASATFGRDGASISTNQEVGPSLAATESLAALLFELCSVAAPSVDIANAWRARWMSLVASTAFQNNPAIQPRAFTVMGCLAREEVDDDLLYQVLVALRTSIGRFSDDNNSDMMVSIVTSLSKMMAKLPSASRYGYQLFWLAMSLLRLVPPSLFNCTAQFLESVLTNISSSGEMRGERMIPFLLQGRAPLEDAALALDEAYGVHFNSENFHFAACACLVRGLTDTMTKSTALRVLSTFLELTSWAPGEKETKVVDMSGSPYMALILARVGSVEELKDSLWHAGISPTSLPNLAHVHSIQDVSAMKEKDLLLNTAMELVDFQYLEDALQNRTLLWLNELAKEKPNVILHL